MKLEFIIRIAHAEPNYLPLISTPYNESYIKDIVYVPKNIYQMRKRHKEAYRKGQINGPLMWIPLEYKKL